MGPLVQVLKQREERLELKLLRVLNRRMELSEEDYGKYISLEKGFIGEKKFDKLASKLSGDWLIINDVLLQYNGSKFQVDSILLSQFKLFNFEIKYFEGDYYIDGKRFYTFNGQEINSPLLQLEKNESILRQIIQNSIMPNLKIISYLVFIHPEFTLYQTPKGATQIILPTKLNRLMKKLATEPTRSTQKHVKFSENLLQLQTSVDPWEYVPKYHFDTLKKGIFCTHCKERTSMMQQYSRSFFICKTCNILEKVDDVILRYVEEIKLLFPDMKITTSRIFEWCGGAIPRSTVRRVLKSHFKLIKKSNLSYYIDPKKYN